jgi:hypothetical protein
MRIVTSVVQYTGSGLKEYRRPLLGRPKLVAVVVAFVATFALTFWALNAWLIDGVLGELLGLVLYEDTAYALGYSDAKWRQMSVGMTEEQVHRILGAPQARWVTDYSKSTSDFGERWSYSPGDTNFRCRVLLFRAGRVVEKHSEFYLD